MREGELHGRGVRDVQRVELDWGVTVMGEPRGTDMGSQRGDSARGKCLGSMQGPGMGGILSLG